MKITTNLLYIIEAELDRAGYNPFILANQLTFFDKTRATLPAIILYDNDEIISACRNTIFFGLDFLPGKVRLQFEKEFISRFINRNIRLQTVEIANAKLISIARINQDMLSYIYTNSSDFILGKSINNNSGNSTNVNRSNTINVDLPQTQVDISLDKESFEYADDMRHDKSRNISENQSQNEQVKYDIKNIEALQEFKENLFTLIDIGIFSQMF